MRYRAIFAATLIGSCAGLAHAQAPVSPNAGDLWAYLTKNLPAMGNPCPALSAISIGSSTNKATWQVQFNGSPSAACNNAVTSLIARFPQ